MELWWWMVMMMGIILLKVLADTPNNLSFPSHSSLGIKHTMKGGVKVLLLCVQVTHK